MLDRIVVAVDGSPACKASLDHAAELTRRCDAGLTGLFVLDNQWGDFIGSDWQSSAGARQAFLDQMRREQEGQAELARRQFLSAAAGVEGARFVLRVGDPLAVILEVANAADTDLLVLSRRVFTVAGRPSLKGLAASVAKQARQPLMLLP